MSKQQQTEEGLYKDFRQIVLDFCKRQGIEPRNLGCKIGYTNLEYLDNFFVHGIGSTSFNVANRIATYMQSVEPNLKVKIVAFNSTQELIDRF
jgi:hypothetical protein